MARKFYYFDVNGLGEPIRYMLHYGKEEFDDVRYIFNTWPDKTVKDSLPYGQLPLYEEAGRTLNQSLAIARYIARQNDLLPDDPWEQATLDAMVYNIYDFWSQCLIYIHERDPVKKEELKQKILTETIDYFFSRFEKELRVKKESSGEKLSWADFILVGITEAANLYLDQEIDKQYVLTGDLVQKIRTLPGIKEYIANRKPYTIR